MYPVLKEGVSFGTFHVGGSGAAHYYIENADGDQFEVSRRLWNALRQADGTGPLKLPDRGREILPVLKRHGLVQTSRFVRDGGLFNRLVLFPIGSRVQKYRPVCRAVNAMLPAASILILAIGVCLALLCGSEKGNPVNWWLYYGLLAGSLALHEGGHLVAGIAYGYEISDTGILLLGIIPMGAYVAHREKRDATSRERIQFSLAGIEVNLLLAGSCFLAAALCKPLSGTMVSIAYVNMILAGVNLLPTSGLDGEFVLSDICGVDNIGRAAKKWLRSRKRRQKLRSSGLAGCVCGCAFVFTLVSKVLLWLAVGLDVVALLLYLL